MPRIESLSLVASLPFGSYGSLGGSVTAEGSSPDAASTPIEVGIHVAGPRFFTTMGFPIVAGWDFDERDAADAPPFAILSSAEAIRLFGSDRNAIGKRVIPPEEFNSPPLQVVGVFENGRKTAGFEERALYTTFLQRPRGRAMTLVVKAASAGDLNWIAEAVRKSIQPIDPVMPIAEVRKGEDQRLRSWARYGSPPKSPCCLGSWR